MRNAIASVFHNDAFGFRCKNPAECGVFIYIDPVKNLARAAVRRRAPKGPMGWAISNGIDKPGK